MGSGKWDDSTYHSTKSSRAAMGVDDFAYTKTAAKTGVIHPALDPMRISTKPFGKLESRDSTEHPASNAVLVCFDVTGSNIARAVDAQKALPGLMGLLTKYLTDPQVAVAGNDDVTVVSRAATQISDFESDIRIDEHIRNIWLVGEGGGNKGESYDLLLYAAARKTVLDCFEKRNKKGYMFMYADEPFFNEVDPAHVEMIFGDKIQSPILIGDIIEEVRKMYELFVIWPRGGYDEAREQYIRLLGEESVVELQHPNLICEMIGSLVGAVEGRTTVDDLTKDLALIGADSAAIDSLTKSLVPIVNSHSMTKLDPNSPLAPQSDRGATRL